MGNTSSSTMSSTTPNAEQLAAEVAALPRPRRSDELWVASCRPVSSLCEFTPYTLIFQPDCRLFCPSGERCKVPHQSHRDLFIHTSVRAIRAEAAAAPPTAVRNQAAFSFHTTQSARQRFGTELTVPHVPECWAYPEEEAAEDWALPAALQGRRVFVWVHGFRQKYFRVVSIASHLQHRLPPAEDGTVPPLVLAFAWPCHSAKVAYVPARTDAMRAAPRLRRLLCALRRAGADVSVVAHSMGCRVALQALLQPEGDGSGSVSQGGGAGDAAARRPLCGHLHLLGAAVDADVLGEGGEFARERLEAGAVTVYSSRHDETLRDHYKLGETVSGNASRAAALGLVGAHPRAAPVAGVETVDVSASVAGHNPNGWLLSPEVADRIAGPGAARAAPPASAPRRDDGGSTRRPPAREWSEDSVAAGDASEDSGDDAR